MSTARWFLVFSLLASALIVVYYWQYAASGLEAPSGRTPHGLFLGILGSAAMIGALLYSVRRRFLARAMSRIKVDPSVRKELKEREEAAFKKLQALQRRMLSNPRDDVKKILQEARKILKEHAVTRHVRVRLAGGRGPQRQLIIERREWTGRLEVWYYWHLALGSLSLLLILAHAGFRFGNLVATVAFLFLVGVVATGVLGYIIYWVVPPALTQIEDRVKRTPEELRMELEEVTKELAQLVEQKSPRFRDIYQQEIAIPGVSSRPSVRWLWGPAKLERDFDRPARLKLGVSQVPESEHEDFLKMANLLFEKEKLEIILYPQLRYDYLLKAWLVLHIPLTAGLMVFSVIHIVSTFYYW
ncbi:MAG TPA: hypothetical protein VNN62_18490 [Methylomirabilota bacterium]|nr:hypothetical protein [Methylomirabilota bacterium]